MSLLKEPEHFDHLTDSVMIRALDGRIASWNQSAAAFYGWRKEEAIGQISHNLLQTQFPQPLEEIESELVENGLWVGELVHTTRSGGRVKVTSRWVLDPSGRSRAVFEINGRSTRRAIELAFPNRDKTVPIREASAPDVKVPVALIKAANVVLTSGAALCGLAYLSVLYYYGWTEQLQFSTSISAALHYGLPLVLACILALALRLRASDKIHIVLVFVSVIAAAYITELVLTMVGSASVVPITPVMSEILMTDKTAHAAALQEKFGVDVDTRSATEVIADLKASGDDAVPFVSPRNNLFINGPGGTIKSALTLNGNEFLPLAGVSNKATVLCNENGSWTTYKSDRYGFNNPDDLWAGNAEIATLGDSFTHGYCVPTESSFVGLIRRRYPTTLNLGIAGDGPLLELATLKEYLPPVRPKVVLWFYFEGNDLTDLRNETNSQLLTHFLSDDFTQGLRTKQSAIDEAIKGDFAREKDVAARTLQMNKDVRARTHPIEKLLEFTKLSKLRQRFGLATGVSSDDRQMASDLKGSIAHIFREILWQADSRVSGWGGQLYFVYLPDWPRYARTPGIGGEERDQVLKLVHSLGIPLIDVQPSFDAQKDPLSLFPFRGNGHYNEEGHRVVAEEVVKALQSQRLP